MGSFEFDALQLGFVIQGLGFSGFRFYLKVPA